MREKKSHAKAKTKPEKDDEVDSFDIEDPPAKPKAKKTTKPKLPEKMDGEDSWDTDMSSQSTSDCSGI